MPNVQTPSQNLIPIKEIKDGLLILKDGSIRLILMNSSVNFALKSSDEQTALIAQYQNFLNSLDFSVQFFITSRNLNIDPYIETLRKREEETTSELLKIQINEYMDFVKEFVSTTQIVSKSFYTVIPYSLSMITSKGMPIFDKLKEMLPKAKPKAPVAQIAQDQFEEGKLQLEQRADTVIQGLARIGIRSVPLNTEELIELFYGLYNPGEVEKSKLPQLSQSQ